MGANLDLSLVADLPYQNMVMVLLNELINFQNGLIARLKELDTYYSTQITTKINSADDFLEVIALMLEIRLRAMESAVYALQLDKMHTYSRRLQTLNRNILELTKQVRMMMLRVQALSEVKAETVDLPKMY